MTGIRVQVWIKVPPTEVDRFLPSSGWGAMMWICSSGAVALSHWTSLWCLLQGDVSVSSNVSFQLLRLYLFVAAALFLHLKSPLGTKRVRYCICSSARELMNLHYFLSGQLRCVLHLIWVIPHVSWCGTDNGEGGGLMIGLLFLLCQNLWVSLGDQLWCWCQQEWEQLSLTGHFSLLTDVSTGKSGESQDFQSAREFSPPAVKQKMC